MQSSNVGRDARGNHPAHRSSAGEFLDPQERLDRLVQAVGTAGLEERAGRIRRMLHARGATYNPHDADPQRWRLDPIPVVVDAADWGVLCKGLDQRARVLDAVLVDLAGPRRLLSRGEIPAEALWADPCFLLPMSGSTPTVGPRLVSYAADLARRPDGSFAVLGDRTEAPAGMGFALQNRQVHMAVSPDLIGDMGAAGLESFFATMRDSLFLHAPTGQGQPRVVMLSPGPSSSTYFEHSFLARNLGFTLVESQDLTVRQGRVCLRAVHGLEPVHVIWSQLHTPASDPLEFPEATRSGVAGLAEAERRGTVGVVNPLGAGLAANPLIGSSADELCRVLLGEEPLLASPQGWWCGSPSERSHVLSNLDDMVVHRIGWPEARPLFGRRLSRSERAELTGRIAAAPHRYVGRKEVVCSSERTFIDGRIQERHVALTAFVAATRRGNLVMPGALSRIVDDEEFASPTSLMISKDTWIVPGHGGGPLRLRRDPESVVVLAEVDLRASVTSRVAESMYWFGRNAERAEMVLRLVRAFETGLEQAPELADEVSGAWLTNVTDALDAVVGPSPDKGAAKASDATKSGAAARPTTESSTSPVSEMEAILRELAAGGVPRPSIVQDALQSMDRPRSVASSLRFLMASAVPISELLSTDTWRVLSTLQDQSARLAETGSADARDDLIATMLSLSGLMNESMVRDPGWRFLDIGRRLERAKLLSALVRAMMCTVPPEEVTEPIHVTLLTATESLVSYRRRHRSRIDAATLLVSVLLDADNPRAMRFQLDRLTDDLGALRALDTDTANSAARLDDLIELVARPKVAAAMPVSAGHRPRLIALLDDIDSAINKLADTIEFDYFALVQPTVMGGFVSSEGLPSAGEP